MKFATLCSGIGAPEQAWIDFGWTSVFCAEIEPFPCAVLNSRHPGTRNIGNIVGLHPDESIDLLIAGTPCQSFSVAGKRAGLDDARGVLVWEFLRIARELQPRWIVWENVPGVLSSGDRRDFGNIIGAMEQLGYGVCWRVLDAQHFGVPQRRRRVFAVGYFGDWRRAAAVLFDAESLRGDSPARGTKGQEDAGTLGAKSKGGGVDATDYERNGGYVARPLKSGGNDRHDESHETYIAPSVSAANTKANGHGIAEDCAHTLDGAQGQAIALQGISKRTGKSTDDSSIGIGIGNEGNPMYTLQSGEQHGVATRSTVRRLTPRECERLQGFPDDYTLINFRGKPAADGPRYRAIGNSMAVPVIRWIGKRIQMIEAIA